jgi:hypothetical protein
MVRKSASKRPFLVPGNTRFRSRPSGNCRDILMKPNILIMGIIILFLGLLIFFGNELAYNFYSIYLVTMNSSRKQNYRAINFRTGYDYRILSLAVLCNLAISISMVLLSPGRIDSPSMLIAFVFFISN